MFRRPEPPELKPSLIDSRALETPEEPSGDGGVFEHGLVQVRRHRNRIFAAEARIAETIRIVDDGAQVRDAQVLEAFHPEVLADLVNRHRRRDQFASRRHIDSVEAGELDGGRRDAQVDFLRTGLSEHDNEFFHRGTTNDGIVHYHYALTLQDSVHRVELQPHRSLTEALAGLDERTTHVVIPNQPNLERNARGLS